MAAATAAVIATAIAAAATIPAAIPAAATIAVVAAAAHTTRCLLTWALKACILRARVADRRGRVAAALDTREPHGARGALRRGVGVERGRGAGEEGIGGDQLVAVETRVTQHTDSLRDGAGGVGQRRADAVEASGGRGCRAGDAGAGPVGPGQVQAGAAERGVGGVDLLRRGR